MKANLGWPNSPGIHSNGTERHRDLYSKLYDQLAQGVIYCHTRINDNTKKSLEAASFTYALIELLVEKDLITIDALDARKKEVADRLVERFAQSGLGLLYQDPEFDKYTFDQAAEVDCGNCLNTCKAICCKFPFALSRQDVEEGIVRWEFKRPYLIAHDADGYCVHLDRTTYQCSVHSHRPVPCRGFDCRDSDRWKVWNDGDQRQLNSELFDRIRQANRIAYAPNEPEI